MTAGLPHRIAHIRVSTDRRLCAIFQTQKHPAQTGCFSLWLLGQEVSIPWEREVLLVIAREELRQTLGITAEPQVSRVFIWSRAMPQYNLGHPEKLAQVGGGSRAGG